MNIDILNPIAIKKFFRDKTCLSVCSDLILLMTYYDSATSRNGNPIQITNERIVIYHLNFVLGIAGIMLPPHISQSKSIVKLTKDQRSQTCTDNLCAFSLFSSSSRLLSHGFGVSYKCFISAVGLI